MLKKLLDHYTGEFQNIKLFHLTSNKYYIPWYQLYSNYFQTQMQNKAQLHMQWFGYKLAHLGTYMTINFILIYESKNKYFVTLKKNKIVKKNLISCHSRNEIFFMTSGVSSNSTTCTLQYKPKPCKFSIYNVDKQQHVLVFLFFFKYNNQSFCFEDNVKKKKKSIVYKV